MNLRTEDQGGEKARAKGQPLLKSSGRRSAPIGSVGKVGIWVQGVDRLGAAYEGIWRVIKRFLVSSDGSRTTFLFAIPARFRDELEEFLATLPDDVRANVEIHTFGDVSDRHDASEAVRQASHANKLDVDAWLVPNPMWGAAKHLVRPKLVWFHDFLLVEFPQSYPRGLFLEFQTNVRDLADAGAFFVFTSPYVMEKHGHEFCRIPADQSTLILNPPIEAAEALQGVPTDPEEAADLIRSELREHLREWCSAAHADLFYHHISSYPFERVPYFYVSSQNREHKGFLRLAQAHSTLLRRRYSPYSIFTTALVDVAGSSPLEKFLKAELLLGDFMSVGKISDQTNALLYRFARMTLHPSTFEGNLPLPFAESVSVGTPCIMPYSRAYASYVDSSLHPWMFYDPTPSGIVQKIEEVDARRSDFVSAQSEILGILKRHSLKNFFDLHMLAFERAVRIEPRLVDYVIASEDLQPASQRRSRLKTFFARPIETMLHGQAGEPMAQARLWEPFDLISKTSSEAGGDTPVLHWATYLGGMHPKGDCYFAIGVADDSNLQLFAEIGSWIEDEYQVAESKPFRFDGLDELPTELLGALERTKLREAFQDRGRIGWVKLGWTKGMVPEIRIGGSMTAPGSQVEARLVCLANIRSPVATRAPSHEFEASELV